MTDVLALRDNGVGVSVANMSAGYYNPHQACEYIVLADLERVCALMLDICATCDSVYKFRPAKHIWSRSSRTSRTSRTSRDPFPEFRPVEREIMEEIDTWPHDPWYKKYPA
jgi:hypothetical protein